MRRTSRGRVSASALIALTAATWLGAACSSQAGGGGSGDADAGSAQDGGAVDQVVDVDVGASDDRGGEEAVSDATDATAGEGADAPAGDATADADASAEDAAADVGDADDALSAADPGAQDAGDEEPAADAEGIDASDDLATDQGPPDGDAADAAPDAAADGAEDMLPADGAGDDDGGTDADASAGADADADAGADVAGDGSEDGTEVLLPDLVPIVPANQIWVDEVVFTEQSCAVQEECIVGVGDGTGDDASALRRILRFTVATANVGTADLALGSPVDNPLFHYSPCHGHYHFEQYADYELLDADGNVAASGHKQAFCLLDSARYLTGDPTVSFLPRYSCDNQGLQRGWEDLYTSDLDCQWIDITDLPPGDYVIHVSINPAHVLDELDYDNNEAFVPITLGTPDLANPCPPFTPDGPSRSCGWRLDSVQSCTPGQAVRLACNSRPGCALGSFTGDPMLRVCAGASASCFPSTALGSSDDACGAQGPYTQVTCPDSGSITVWDAPYQPGRTYACNVARLDGAAPDADAACGGDPAPPAGLARNCDWDVALDMEPCHEGFEYWVGCNPAYCALDAECPSGPEVCGLPPVGCDGDPMIRVCRGGERCARGLALAESNTACGDACPEVRFSCPEDGAFTVLTAPYQDGDPYTCEVGSARIIDLTPSP